MSDERIREVDHSQPAPRRRAAHLGPERRRPLVLDAAFDLFLERGYEGTSMEAVADAAGVTKPVVYACFSSKEELFEALLRREEARLLDEIQRSLPPDSDVDDPEPLLVEGLTAFLRAVAASPDAYRIIFLGEGATTAVAHRIQLQRAAQVEAVAALSRAWLKRRDTSVDIDAAASLFAGVVVGLAESGARAMLSDPDTWTPERLGRMLGRMAARGRGVF
jgi:AcrR family transcriptional regulator